MRFDGLDLNLLIALDSLLKTRSVTVSAEQLALSQPAMSGHLNRLREYFRDDLLRNSGSRGMTLTPFAQSLAAPVRAILVQIRSTITSKPDIDPTLSERHFTIAASHYAIVARVAPALNAIHAIAPRMKFTLRSLGRLQVELIESGAVDLLITWEEYIGHQHPSRPMLVDDIVVAAWKANSRIRGELDEDLYFDLRHVEVRFDTLRHPAFEERIVKSADRHRKIEIVVPSFADVPPFIIGTDRVATIQNMLAREWAQHLPLSIYPLPVRVAPVRLAVQWSALLAEDPGLLLVVDALCGQPPPSTQAK